MLTSTEYFSALDRIAWLMAHQDDLTPEQEDELEVLAIQAEEYERDHFIIGSLRNLHYGVGATKFRAVADYYASHIEYAMIQLQKLIDRIANRGD